MRLQNRIPSGVLVLSACLLLQGCQNSSITLSLEPDQKMITGSPIAIDVKTAPLPSRIDPNNVMISGGDSWVENGKVMFQAEQPGTYTVSVDQGKVKSNDLSVTVTDRYAYFNGQSQTDSSQADNSQAASSENSDSSQIKSGDHLNVDQVYAAQDQLISSQTSVIVEGNLPQALVTDKTGQQVPVLWNDAISKYLILDGFNIPFGGCKAEVTGTLSRDAAGQLVLNMSYISTDEKPAVNHSDNSESDGAADGDQDDSQSEDSPKQED